MGLEIEHKFLVKNIDFLKNERGTKYSQGYIPTSGNPGLRVRVAGNKAFITLKSDVSPDGVRHEFEYEVPVSEAEEMIELFCSKPIIEKYRYKVEFHGMVWEVDVFEGDNAGLVIAEIELEEKGQSFDIPEWAAEDVTHLKRYCNSRLAVHPFSKWSEEEKSNNVR